MLFLCHRLRPEGLEVHRLQLKQQGLQHRTAMERPTPPPHGSPGGAPGSSNDPPAPSAAPKAGRTTPPPPKARPTAAAVRHLTSSISASDWDEYVAGMGETSGFTVAGEARPRAPSVPARSVCATLREPDTSP